MDSIFTNISRKDPTYNTNVMVNGSQILNNLSKLSTGNGNKVFRMDQRGIWLGASDFADAPFSVDMLGNIIAAGLLTASGQNQNFTGTINIGSAQIKIDGVNGRIVINDGTTNRIVIGNV